MNRRTLRAVLVIGVVLGAVLSWILVAQEGDGDVQHGAVLSPSPAGSGGARRPEELLRPGGPAHDERYNGALERAVPRFAAKCRKRFPNVVRRGCLDARPLKAAESARFLIPRVLSISEEPERDPCATRIDFTDGPAERLCAELERFAKKERAGESSDVRRAVDELNQLLGKLSINVDNQTDSTIIVQQLTVGPRSRKTVSGWTTGFCDEGGPPPLLVKVEGTDRRVRPRLCEPGRFSDADGVLEVEVQPPSLAEGESLTGEPYAVGLTVRYKAAKEGLDGSR